MKKLFCLIVATIISSLLFSTSFAAETEWTEIPPSDTYLDYLEHPEKYEIAPPYYDAADADNQKSASCVPKAGVSAELPEKYDVRDDGVNPLIKDQSTDLTCSIFAVLGNYEILTAKKNNTAFFSEYHAKHALAQNYSDGINFFGLDRVPSDGLHLRWVAPYLMNGRGPVDLSSAPYLRGNTLVASTYVDSLKPEFQTQEIQVYPGLGEEATDEEIADWLIELKSLVYEYGSVAITMTSNSLYSDTTNTYFYSSSMPSYHDHAVVCIGWDDTIPAEKFTNRNGETPLTDGGLIFRNSWSTDWGDDGYGYISYDSVGIALQDFLIVSKYRDRYDNETVHTYAELGANSLVGASTLRSQWFGNKFYLDKGEYVNLKEVSFYAPISDIQYDVYISLTGEVDRNKFTYISSVTPEYPGYYSVPTDFDLGSEKLSEFFVVVKSNCGATYYAIPVEGLSNNFSNICSQYITYFENDERIIIPYTTDNENLMTENGIEWSFLETGFLAKDNYAFTSYSVSNVAVNAITEPLNIEINATASISYTQAVQGDEITVTTSVDGNGSGHYSYSYKLFSNGICIEEFTDSSENYTFIPTEIAEYYVEVTVTDVKNNAIDTAVTDTVSVGKAALAIDFELIDNYDGTYTVQGGTVYPDNTVKYFIYVLKDGAILYKSVYTSSLSLEFNADEEGTYTIVTYAQDSSRYRVSKAEKFTK